jgi:hypothetical protein
MKTVTPLTPEQLAQINPGIRHTVQVLRSWGYETTDSGDGATADHACDLPIPYVHIRIDGDDLVVHMKFLIAMLAASGVEVGPSNEVGDNPTIEGCILADLSAWIHLFNVVIPE